MYTRYRYTSVSPGKNHIELYDPVIRQLHAILFAPGADAEGSFLFPVYQRYLVYTKYCCRYTVSRFFSFDPGFGCPRLAYMYLRKALDSRRM